MSPTPTPPAASEIAEKLPGWIDSIVGIISGAIQNPYLAIIAVVVVMGGGLVAYLLISGKITQWRREAAKAATDQGKEDFIKDQVPANGQKNDQDQANRDKLKDLP